MIHISVSSGKLNMEGALYMRRKAAKRPQLGCTCSSGCLLTKCNCINVMQPCIATCRCVGVLHNCINPVNVLQKAGVDMEKANEDECLVARVLKVCQFLSNSTDLTGTMFECIQNV